MFGIPWRRIYDSGPRIANVVTQHHIKTSIGKYPQPTCYFAHILINIVARIPQSHGYHYLLTITYRTTRWPETTPTHNETAVTCASTLLTSWISQFGLLEHITSDCGGPFISGIWSYLTRLLSVVVYPLPQPFLVWGVLSSHLGSTNHPPCTSGQQCLTLVRSVHKPEGDNVVCMWGQLKI